MTRDGAETIALNCLAFLAEDGGRLTRFMALTGLDPDALREGAVSPSVQQAALDHLLADESLLLMFAGNAGVAPETIVAARGLLDDDPANGGRG